MWHPQVTALETPWTIATEMFEASGEPGSEEWRREIGNSAESRYLENAAVDEVHEVDAYALNIVGTEDARPRM